MAITNTPMFMPDEEPGREPEDGIALCLSGGGYRAMVFHVGALIRLNEAGLLPKLSRISSVSGGSITNAVLGLHWEELRFDSKGVAKLDLIIDEVRKMAGITLDVGAVIGGILLSGTINERVANAYNKHLFHDKKLQDLPDEVSGKSLRFIFHATNVQTGALWRFSKKYMGDYRVGLVEKPDVRLADVVAASSAFPPVLSPMVLKITQPVQTTKGADLHSPPYTEEVVLSDGGVYDNLGLETAFKRYKTVLVSDGGQKIAPDPSPAHNWAEHSIRIINIIDNQVRSLRKRFLIDAFQRPGDHTGTYWGIWTDYKDYRLDSDPLGCAARDPTYLAEIPTRLERMDSDLQEQLINWGYAVCDAALRKHFGADLQAKYGVTIQAPTGFPYPQGYRV
jgi:NTE family protein